MSPDVFALNEVDVIRVIEAYLHGKGLHMSLAILEKETGVVNVRGPEEVLGLRRIILDGRWDEVESYVHSLPLPEGSVKFVLYLVAKQQYLELVFMCSEIENFSSQEVNTEIFECVEKLHQHCPCPVEYDSLRKLLALTNLFDSPEYSNFNPHSSRESCLREVCEILADTYECSALPLQAASDRLLDLLIKGVLYESCEDFCLKKSSKKTENVKGLHFGNLIHDVQSIGSTLGLYSWLKSVPWVTMRHNFTHRQLQVQMRTLEKPDIRHLWLESVVDSVFRQKKPEQPKRESSWEEYLDSKIAYDVGAYEEVSGMGEKLSGQKDSVNFFDVKVPTGDADGSGEKQQGSDLRIDTSRNDSENSSTHSADVLFMCDIEGKIEISTCRAQQKSDLIPDYGPLLLHDSNQSSNDTTITSDPKNMSSEDGIHAESTPNKSLDSAKADRVLLESDIHFSESSISEVDSVVGDSCHDDSKIDTCSGDRTGGILQRGPAVSEVCTSIATLTITGQTDDDSPDCAADTVADTPRSVSDYTCAKMRFLESLRVKEQMRDDLLRMLKGETCSEAVVANDVTQVADGCEAPNEQVNDVKNSSECAMKPIPLPFFITAPLLHDGQDSLNRLFQQKTEDSENSSDQQSPVRTIEKLPKNSAARKGKGNLKPEEPMKQRRGQTKKGTRLSLSGSSQASGSNDSSEQKQNFIAVTRLQDEQAIRSVEFHPSGKFYAVGSNTKTLRICAYPNCKDIRSDHEAREPTVLYKRQKHHKGSIYCMAWNATGDLLATGSNDKTVKLMKFNSSTFQMDDVAHPLTMHGGTVRDMCFMEDVSNRSNLLISGGSGDNKIYVTDCETAMTFQSLTGHTGQILSLYTWGGVMFVSSSQDKTIRFWDMRTRGCVNLIPARPAGGTGPGSAAATISVDPSGRLLVSGHEDSSCMLYDMKGSRILQTFRPHQADVRTARLSPKAFYLLTGSYDCKLMLTDLQGDLTQPLSSVRVAEHDDKVIQGRWHPQEFTFLSTSADKTATLWTLPPT